MPGPVLHLEMLHTYFPLIIGKKYIYEGDTGDGLEHIEVILTNQTRAVMGVTCMVYG